jgi:DNA-directed RNA polymerase specialized sigma24 family protein
MVGERIDGTWALDQAAFDALLDWLGPDRERAAEAYERIRARLVRIFVSRGCPLAEDLADETINRVSRKVPEIAGGYTGDPAFYFYGVANRVHMEYVRRSARQPVAPPPVAPPDEEEERAYECLEGCLAGLQPATREIVLEYYRGESGGAKIDRRRELAERHRIGLNALRIRLHRIRAGLFSCVQECMRGQEAP